MNFGEHPKENGLYSLELDTYDPRVLRHVVDPDVPLVFLERHFPHARIEWFEAVVPVSEKTLLAPTRQLVRNVTMDIVLPTSEFLERIDEFEAFEGVNLYQTSSTPPETLDLASVKHHARGKVYDHVGIRLAFWAPSLMDQALCASTDRDIMERLASRLNAAGF